MDNVITMGSGFSTQWSSIQKRRVCCALIAFVLVCGCGSDEGSPPMISDIQYSPTWALIGWGGGTLSILGTIDFVDPDGDVSYAHVSDRECGSGPVQNLDIRLASGVAGRTSGTVVFVALVATNCPAGSYAAGVSVVDAQGHESNGLSVPFDLVPATTP